jgi:hypothetical protein
MPTSTESAQVHRRSRASFPSVASGLFLYLLTLVIEALIGASTRWLLVYLGLAKVVWPDFALVSQIQSQVQLNLFGFGTPAGYRR